jgi:hypothetical protein
MLNRTAVIAVAAASGLFLQAAPAASCGQNETLSRMQAQALAYAAGRSYLEAASTVAADPSALCAETAAETEARQARLTKALARQALAYASGDQSAAYRLATVEGRQPNSLVVEALD